MTPPPPPRPLLSIDDHVHCHFLGFLFLRLSDPIASISSAATRSLGVSFPSPFRLKNLGPLAITSLSPPIFDPFTQRTLSSPLIASPPPMWNFLDLTCSSRQAPSYIFFGEGSDSYSFFPTRWQALLHGFVYSHYPRPTTEVPGLLYPLIFGSAGVCLPTSP